VNKKIIEDIVKKIISSYLLSKKIINLSDNIYIDLDIYGDTFEELIEELSVSIQFRQDIFWDLFDYELYMPSEIKLFPTKLDYLEILCYIEKIIKKSFFCKKLKDYKYIIFKQFSIEELINLIIQTLEYNDNLLLYKLKI